MNYRRRAFPGGWPLALLAGLACCARAAEPDKSAATHPYPAGAQGDLWFIGGQSNMCGFGTLKEKIKPDPRILFFAAKADQWMPACQPFHSLFFPRGDPHGMVDEKDMAIPAFGPVAIPPMAEARVPGKQVVLRV